jgi:DNA-binding MarR family transcriptional regulator
MLTTHCLCTKLRRAARQVTRLYDNALGDLGINAAQYSLLQHLDRLERPSISSLAQAMGLDRSTLGRNLRVVQGMGLVEILGGEDQRNRLVQLSDCGRQCLAKAQVTWEETQSQLTVRLGHDKRELLMELLGDLEACG